MRYLNRVVFIQSAHVPYAEINLDGNVHFIGTQGVGKTTLLRILIGLVSPTSGKILLDGNDIKAVFLTKI